MKKIICTVLALALCACAVFGFAACGKEEKEPDTTAADLTDGQDGTEPAAPVSGATSRVNGLPVDESRQNERLVGIVVENTPAARPQWGFTTPAMVIEYEVEGGITRMLWVYDGIEDVPEAVGPVRSARHDAVELAMGMDLMFVHIGGSDIAYDLMNNYVGSFDHLDGNAVSSFHHKDTSRNTSSEHRSVVVGSQLADEIASRGIRMTTDRTSLFTFGERALAGMPCSDLHISYSGNYSYDFTFDPATGNYTAVIDGAQRTDDGGKVCEYKNLLILYTDMTDLGDSSGHQDLLLENGGSGLYICDGAAEGITWTKGGTAEGVQLFSADGMPLVINPGVTYMGFVRSTQAGQTTVS